MLHGISSDTGPNSCGVCNGPVRYWFNVPGDCKRRIPNPVPHVYICDKCGYGQIHPVPEPEDIAEFYDLEKYYTHGEGHFEESGQITLLDRIRVHIAWRFDRGTPLTPEGIHDRLNHRQSRICDIGTGDGALAVRLAELGHSVVGVEVDTSALAKQHADTIGFYAGTGENLPPELASRKFDAVVLCHVLEHCRNPRAALENTLDLLDSDGFLVVEVPNNAATACEQLGPAWEMFDAPRHLHFFTPNSLQDLAEKAGFSVDEVFFGGFTRHFSNSWINTERAHWSSIYAADYGIEPARARNSKLRSWQLLLRTLIAAPERKYDSVGIFASNRQGKPR